MGSNIKAKVQWAFVMRAAMLTSNNKPGFPLEWGLGDQLKKAVEDIEVDMDARDNGFCSKIS